MAAPKRFVVLDRDGTLIVERHYLADPAGVELIAGAGAALCRLREMGLGLVIITNQSAIGRGMLNRGQLEKIHARMTRLLAQDRGQGDGIYYCPPVPDDGCPCRKPETGLLRQAAKELGFRPNACFVIGDKACDVELGRKVGATTVLVRTGYGAQAEAQAASLADHIIESVAALPELIGAQLEAGKRRRAPAIAAAASAGAA